MLSTFPLTPEIAAVLITRALRLLGGKGSGNFGHLGRPGEKGGSSSDSGRSDRASASHKPSTREKQILAHKTSMQVANFLNGEHTRDQHPMDIIVKSGTKLHGIEVKTLIDNKNDKITMHPESKARKEDWLKSTRATGHTVVVDRRSPSTRYYYSKGFGSFRVGAMQRLTKEAIKKLVS